MVTICLQCGDKGFSNALVYCVKCLEVAVHRYCLDELPDTFDEFVHWVCDNCEFGVPQEFVSLNSEPIQLDSRDCTNSKHVEPSSKKKSKRRRTLNVVLDTAEHICDGVTSEKPYKVDAEIDSTKSALLAVECSPLEVKQKACDGATPITKTKDQISPRSSSPHVDDTNSEVGSHHSQCPGADVTLKKMKTKKKNKKDKIVRKFSSEKLIQRLGYRPYERPCEAYTENKLNDQDDSTELKKEAASPSEGENNKKNKKNKDSSRNFPLSENLIPRNGYSPSGGPCESYTENTLNEHKESRELEKEKDSLSEAKMECGGRQSCEVNSELEVTVNNAKELEISPSRYGPCYLDHLPDNVTLCGYELAQPLADPIWRGSFNILNKDYDAFEGMVAHLSKKACHRAYEEAMLFPTLLNLEMHPKLDVWPKSFEKSEPSDDSIALYFFPMHKRYERMFDDLVEEMLSHGLAMTAILRNAELLVFTSTELPLNYWRFQGKYYLWGVFRAKRPPSAQSASNNHVGTRKAWDAESPNPLSNRSVSSGA